ncbi:MAG: ABC transporter permease [Armatimonadota bacterium]|nr:ABC transporter permease [Armatimonadota bacterium]
MGPLAALKAEIKLALIKMARYPLQTLSSLIVLYILFTGLFYGSRAIATGDLLPPSEGLAGQAIVGFFLWYLALFAIDSMSQAIGEEAQTGTLEQFYLARWDFALMLFFRFVASLASSMVMAIPLFLLLKFSTGATVPLDLIRASLIVGITTIGLCGFGYVLAGLTLLFKRLGNAISIVQFGLLFLALTPIERLSPPLKLAAATLPLAQGVKLLRVTLEDGGTLSASLLQMVLLIANALVYLLIGLLWFRWAEKMARERGLMSHY